MGDIDFDELDKAVNSLMGNVGKTKEEETTEQEVKTLNLDNTLQPGEKPTHDKVDQIASQINDTTQGSAPAAPAAAPVEASGAESQSQPQPQAPEAQPVVPAETMAVPSQPPVVPVASVQRPVSSGRFMDVVHPSSDMRTSSGVPSPSAAVPMAGPVVSPFTTPPTPEATQPTATNAGDDLPLTPFLPDANTKVEKRPLGSAPFSDAEKTPEDLMNSIMSPEAGSGDKIEAVEETAPINSDFTSVRDKEEEKGQAQRPLDPTKFNQEEIPGGQELQSIESIEVPGADPDPDEESVRAVESGDTGRLRGGAPSPTPAMPIGIDSQQQPNGAIYDVNNYHQPLGQPAKQKSGWGTVLIIILIIAVCIGIAAAAYFILGLGV